MKEYYTHPRTSQNLIAIDELSEQLPLIRLPRTFIPVWKEKNLRRSVWLAGLLTGHELTLIEVNRGCRTGKLEAAPVLVNYYRLLKEQPWLREKKITGRFCVKIYQILLKNTEAKNPKIKEARLKEILAWVSEDQGTRPLVKAGVAFKQIIDSRIFSCENQLMARLISLMITARAGYRWPRLTVLENYDLLSLTRYQARITRPSQEDFAPWLDYYIKGWRFALQESVDQLTQFSESLWTSHRLTTGEKAALKKLATLKGQPRLQKVADLFGVSKQRAHVILGGLVTEGLVDKLGKSKTISYRLSWRALGKLKLKFTLEN
jgi:hypothetical protein